MVPLYRFCSSRDSCGIALRISSSGIPKSSGSESTEERIAILWIGNAEYSSGVYGKLPSCRPDQSELIQNIVDLEY